MPETAADAELLAAAAGRVEPARGHAARPRRAVRRRGPRAVPGGRQRPRRGPGPAGRRPRLRHRRPPGRRAADAAAVGRCAVGHRDSSSAPSAPARTRTASRSPPTAPTATTRCRATREVRFGTSLEGDLVRRDFTVNAMAVRITADGPATSSTRSAGWRRSGSGCSTRPPRPRCRSATTRCGCCARRGSSRSSVSRSRRGCAAAIEEMAPQLGRITAERVAAELDKTDAGRRPGRRHRADGRHRRGRGGAAGDRRRCGWPSTSTTSTRTSTGIR